jgi:Recombinase
LNALEREQGVEQAALVAEKKLAENKALGGTAPVGYDFEVTGKDSNGKDVLGWLIANEEAPLVRATLEAFADGASVGKVADLFNAAGIHTRPTKRNPGGSPWRTVTARRFLRRAEVYTGVRVYGERRVEGAHKAIIEPGLWRRVQKRLVPVEVEGKRTRVRGDGYALGCGLVRCGKCGHSLMRSRTNGTREILRCDERGGGHPSITLALATDYVADVAFRHYGAFNYTRTEGGNVEAREAAEAVLRHAQADLRDAEEFIGAKLPIDSKQRVAVDEAQAALEALDPEDAILRTFVVDPEWGGAEDNAARFAAFPAPAQRKLLRALGVEKVVLRAGVKGSPAERLRIQFNDGTTWTEPEPLEPITPTQWQDLVLEELPA